MIADQSEATVYRNAVQVRTSSSSEEEANVQSSDEWTNQINNWSDELRPDYNNDQIDVFLDERRRNFDHGDKHKQGNVQRSGQRESREECPTGDYFKQRNGDYVTPEERAEKYVREVEKAKARMFQSPGTANEHDQIDYVKLKLHTAIIDEDYEMVAAHVDGATQTKIINGEYVDFAKLIPKDKIFEIEDNRLQQYFRDGQTYFAPAPSGEHITSFAKWERAFRVFSYVYTKVHAHRSWELIEYNHTVHSISQMYVWENVYNYDKDFRVHMSKHPSRSWAMTLQRAWAQRLTE